MDSRNTLLTTFQDNNAHMITAADMREFVNSVYDEKLGTDQVVNSLVSNSVTSVLSAKQGQIIDQRLRSIEPQVQENENEIDVLKTKVQTLEDTLSNLRQEIDSVKNILLRGITGSIDTDAQPVFTVTSGIVTA